MGNLLIMVSGVGMWTSQLFVTSEREWALHTELGTDSDTDAYV